VLYQPAPLPLAKVQIQISTRQISRGRKPVYFGANFSNLPLQQRQLKSFCPITISCGILAFFLSDSSQIVL